jgi:ribosomal protein S18 acetylase RimI-like enzyme
LETVTQSVNRAVEVDELRAFLEADELRHITPLKMLGLFGDALAIYRVDALAAHQSEDSVTYRDRGYVLTMPRSMSQWASSKYPDHERIAYPAMPAHASDSLLDAAAQCVLRITERKPFVVNTVDTSLIARLQRASDARLPLSFRLALLTFVPNLEAADAPNSSKRDESIRSFAHIPADASSLLNAQNSYSDRELATMFADGTARCWLRYVDQSPVAVLLTFANSRTLHEMGSLHVQADARRSGHAQALVRAALDDMRLRGLKVRYVVEATNDASIALAERCGLREALRAQHWLSQVILVSARSLE